MACRPRWLHRVAVRAVRDVLVAGGGGVVRGSGAGPAWTAGGVVAVVLVVLLRSGPADRRGRAPCTQSSCPLAQHARLPPGWYAARRQCQGADGGCGGAVFLDRLMSWHNPLVTQAPDFSVKPTITGEKVVLRPFTEDDLRGMLQVLRDPEALKLTGTVHDDAEPGEPGRREQVPRLVCQPQRPARPARPGGDRQSARRLRWRGGAERVGAGQPQLQLPHRAWSRGTRARAGHRGDPPDRRLRF